jgi:hypothetical protein
MVFSRANPLGWAAFEKLLSSQANTMDINQSRALDGYAGGVYNPSAGLTWNEWFVIDASLSAAGTDVVGLTVTGKGVYNGIETTGGSGGAAGIKGQGTGNAHGGKFYGGPTSGVGVHGSGGAPNGIGGTFEGKGTAVGISAVGGFSSGAGVSGTGSASGDVGVQGIGIGVYAGVEGTGGSTDGAGVSGIGGTTNGQGVSGQGTGNGAGVIGFGGSGGGRGGDFQGNGSADGVRGLGGGSGGTGLKGEGGPGSGIGVHGDGAGTGVGIKATAGPSAAQLWLQGKTSDPTSYNEGDVTLRNQAGNRMLWARIDSENIPLTPTWGRVTVAGGGATLNDGFNINASITVTATNVTVTFTRAFANANYGITVACWDSTGQGATCQPQSGSESTTQVSFKFFNNSGGTIIPSSATIEFAFAIHGKT